MDELVEVINRLQDVFAASDCTGIDLPQIVVVGAQSAGKSSVLEHIVGKSFLPRGSGIVTRCPLVLQLVHTPNKKEEFASFQHTKKIFTDFDLVCKEIETETARIAGKNKGICHKSINLKIYSPYLLNLTLVDLPGLVKVPTGDQPVDIEDQIKKMILHYIENPNSIILAVSAANTDMANSESLKIAKQVDPDGDRTLAVLTKLDLMDAGTDAYEMLTGKVIPVKLGIIGVVNRSQKDIQDKKSVIQSLMDEAEFLENKYNDIADSLGTNYLKKTVQSLLVEHIQNCLPKLKERISEKLLKKQTELDNYALSKFDPQTVLLDLVSKFSNAYINALKGDLKDIQTKDLYGGARVNHIFHESFSEVLNNINPLHKLTKEVITAAIKNSSGISPTIFVREVAFEKLVKKQIEQFEQPSIKCVNLVFKELNNVGEDCLNDESLGLNRYPVLKQALGGVLKDILRERLPDTVDVVKTFINVQKSYINSSHPDFLPQQVESVNTNDKKDDQQSNYDDEPQAQLNIKLTSPPVIKKDKSNISYILIQELIKSYFTVVSKMVQDTVPKYIMYFLVNSVMENLHNDLLKELVIPGDWQNLLQESPKVMKKRKALELEVEKLEEAHDIVNNISTTLLEGSSVTRTQNEKKKSFFNFF